MRDARTQVAAVVLSSGCGGLAGSLMAYTSSLAAPGSFPLTLSLELLAAIVIGGLGTLPGAVWGALVIAFAPDRIRPLHDVLKLPGPIRAQLPPALFGLLFLAPTLLCPHGV